jgi:PAS domain S-box-containing protein
MVQKNKTISNFKKGEESHNTQQQINEDMLKISELRYRRLFETAQDAILILDGETGQIMDANPFVQDLLGYSLNELAGKTLWEISPFKNIVENKELFQKLQKETYVRYEHIPLQTKQKKLRYVEFVSNSYMVDHTKVIQCNIRDITERKKEQEKIQEMQKKLEQLVSDRTAQLDVTTQNLTSETKERKKAEDETVKTKDYLENIIDSASEIIFSFDSNNRLNIWNKTAELLTGYKEKEITNRSVESLPVFNGHTKMLDLLKNNELDLLKNNDHHLGYNDLVVITKNNIKKIIRISGSSVKNPDGVNIGSLFIGRDITQNIEAHGKLLVGNSYLVISKNNSSVRDLYRDLTTSGYEGVFISRSSIEMTDNMSNNLNSQLFLLSHEKIKGFETIANPDELADLVKEISLRNKKSIIVVDGAHYFITKFSFEKFIDGLYQINDFVLKSQLIVILRIDPSIVDKSQMAIFENEFQLLPGQKLDDLILDDVLYDMVKYVYEQNQSNSMVSIKKIITKSNVAYSTAAKRLDLLEEKGLIFIKKQGKFQTVYVTEKGKALLNKRQTA